MTGLAKVDFRQVMLLHQLDQAANPIEFEHALGTGAGVIHRDFLGFLGRMAFCRGLSIQPAFLWFSGFGHSEKEERRGSLTKR